MASKVKPLKIDDDNESVSISTQFNVSDDYVDCKGVSFESSDNHLIDRDNGTDELQWRDSVQTSYRKFNDTDAQALAARYTIVLNHNGAVSNNTFYGYSSLLPGDATPIIIPVDCTILEFTWANSNSSADYTLEFRKNGTGVATFYTVSKTNTQFFADDTISETFSQGDEIYVKHIDDGGNASDAAIVLLFQVNP